MGAPGATIDTSAISNIAVRDSNRLVGSVAKALAANSPFIGVLKGGTFASGQGDTVLASLEMQAMPGDSLAVPTFTAHSAIAGTNGTTEKTGKVNLSYTLGSKRGLGPKVNVKAGFGAFKTSYLAAEDALRKLITQYVNADIQAQLVTKCASKFTCAGGSQGSARTFSNNFGGGAESNVDLTWNWTDFALPDQTLPFKTLHFLARYLKEGLFAEMWPAGDKVQPHFRFIGGSDIIEQFRNETNVKEIMMSLTTGGYKLGEQTVSGYSFETSPAYRGIAFGMTHRPLRFNTIGDGNNGTTAGVPVWINPVTEVTPALDTPGAAGGPTESTGYAQVNPAWLAATYEVGVLVADGAFERQTPAEYVGEGSFKFAPQLYMGELEWHYNKDNVTNMWGDYGWHKYQISRAYKPLRPQHIIAIAYKRASEDTGLVTV